MTRNYLFSFGILWLYIYTQRKILHQCPNNINYLRTPLFPGLQLSILALLLKQRQHKFQIPKNRVEREISINLGQAQNSALTVLKSP